jgi:hypothetical protein
MKRLLKVGWLLLALAVMWGFTDRPALADCSWTGQWKASTGVTLNLTQTGDQIQGTYTPKDGEVFGQVSGGTLTGTWADYVGTPGVHDAGDYYAQLSADRACAFEAGQLTRIIVCV